ncbi:hypothetical protein PAF17_16640 [Paracoccus sp. Z330]|uniref:Uncharacterized protein n=1 Tax=Paracoccus onchidii TaxID=3017813 RepID=A0ABT4ZIG1_9RHOB|nr:hypothetical protein [Paracoccus onchidii]MDB6179120.1 hypothetical protein [Paracoccus onchidii]
MGCFKGSTSISFTLLGGSTPLFPDDGSERNLMIWIQHADGRMARVPIEAEYRAGEDNGLIASLQMGQTDKEFFAQASGLEVDVPLEGGRDLFKTGMAGSAAALADILRVCPNA